MMKKILSIYFCFLLFLCTQGVEAQLSSLQKKAQLKDPPPCAKEVEVHCYIATRDQIKTLFSQKEATITQLPTKIFTANTEVYFLARVKNQGAQGLTGMLHLFVPYCRIPFPIKVAYLPPHMPSFYHFVLRFDVGSVRKTDPLPEITWAWDYLQPKAQKPAPSKTRPSS